MIKVLVINQQQSGVDMYRLTPHQYLNSEEFEVVFTPLLDNPPEDLYKQLKEFDIVVCSRMLSKFNDKDWTADIMTHLNKANCKLVMDYDDSWNLPKYHGLHEQFEKKGYRLRQIKAARFADGITCSTPHLKDKLTAYNKNIEVIKNCVDYNDPQWLKFKTPSEKLRVGFIGAKDHVKDMAMISEELCKIGELEDVELYYGGWAPGEENNKIASIMSCAGASNIFDVIPALDVNCYAQMYNHIDVCIAPLYKDDFTQCKSELKALEAGYMGCAIIASNQVPFTYVLNDSNSTLCDKANGWCDAVKKYRDNRDLVVTHSQKLSKAVKEHYDIMNEAKKREEFYKELYSQKK